MRKTMTARTAIAAAALATAAGAAHAQNAIPFTETFSDAAGDGFDFTPWVDDTIGFTFGVNTAAGTFDVELTDDFRTFSTVETVGLPSMNPGDVVTASVDFTLTDFDFATTAISILLFGQEQFVLAADPDALDPQTIIFRIDEPGGFDAPLFQIINQTNGLGPDGTEFELFLDGLVDDVFNYTVVVTLGDGSLTAEFTATNTATGDSETETLELLDPSLDFSAPFVGIEVERAVDTLDSSISFDNFSVSFEPADVGFAGCNSADTEQDGDNDILDVLELLASFDPADPNCTGPDGIVPCNSADTEQDGDNDILDVLELLASFDPADPNCSPA